jgi:hypothetical protein
MWTVLADLVWLAHVAFLVFLPVGGFLAWRWPRVMWAHFVAIAIAVVSVTVNFDCPLTSWEQSFRRRAGHPYHDGFIDHYFTGRAYPHGYQWVVQLVFAACIIVSYLPLYRRARLRRSSREPSPAGGRAGRARASR